MNYVKDYIKVREGRDLKQKLYTLDRSSGFAR
jgi:hypothetical protein